MAVYVYAVTGHDHPCHLDGLTGVGSDAPAVRTLESGKLRAVVSDVAGEIRPKRRDVIAHQAVLDRLMADGTPLPLQFGYIAPDDETVRRALDERAEGYLDALAAVRGCAEYNVKAGQEEDVLLRSILDGSPRASSLNEEILAGDTDPRLPLELGQLVSAEVDLRRSDASAALIRALAPLARAYVVHPPTGEDFLNLSLLVPRDGERPFLDAHAGLSRDAGPGVRTRLAGPLPPYSFVP
ncbi:gas vesicle protein GvpL/GvpF [Streptomyces sp. 3211.6]|uniref:GvpL/GvpF family gas vesicle protein n=1 Tax=Streptomyces TaxID=1883 RepID=UPI0009A55870|nr:MULTISPECIES: GvpL/GvpF family gas vesicle protein [Streptomyces]RKT08491.1 gas vesicle protein GvpL/GvpF [Streptomyces sp. 3211.6]RPF29890.1 gas vesicle protein GvpL/GvpF [Streptomyces sp. Ag109_G2-6]